MAEWAATFGAKLSESESMNMTFGADDPLRTDFGEVQKVSTSDYNDLYNKPKINGVQLVGDRSFEDLGVEELTNMEIAAIFNKVFGGD